jgi:hypothetical protein
MAQVNECAGARAVELSFLCLSRMNALSVRIALNYFCIQNKMQQPIAMCYLRGRRMDASGAAIRRNPSRHGKNSA